jgi:two-component system KDP operon response regulator KdpE
MVKKVLVVDDDPELGALVEVILSSLELTVYHAYSGAEGLKRAYDLHPDLVILDVMMPDMDGFDVCARLRELTSVPILMLTARAKESDLIHSFNVGVDDFIKKPFNKNELEARVRALLRRSGSHKPGENTYITTYQDSVLEIDLASRTIKLLGKIVEFSPREYSLLACLVREQGQIVSHHELAREVWGGLYANEPAMSSLYVHYIRKKLRDGEHGHHYIHTLWGRGYWFAPRNGDETS